MPLTRTTFIRLLKIGGIVIATALIVAYAIWRSLNYARGPKIDITEPVNGASISVSTITIKGRLERADHLFLNGNPLSVDEQGNFTETVIIFPGMNVLTLEAQDQFGRSTKTELDLLGTGQLPVPKKTAAPSLPSGTSTATST